MTISLFGAAGAEYRLHPFLRAAVHFAAVFVHVVADALAGDGVFAVADNGVALQHQQGVVHGVGGLFGRAGLGVVAETHIFFGHDVIEIACFQRGLIVRPRLVGGLVRAFEVQGEHGGPQAEIFAFHFHIALEDHRVFVGVVGHGVRRDVDGQIAGRSGGIGGRGDGRSRRQAAQKRKADQRSE